jgi:hypothetical protein
MTERRKAWRTKIERLEAETRRLFRCETALLQIRDILAASLPPNRAIALRDILTDIICVVEDAGFPLPANQQTDPSAEMPPPLDGNIVLFPPLPRRPPPQE